MPYLAELEDEQEKEVAEEIEEETAAKCNGLGIKDVVNRRRFS